MVMKWKVFWRQRAGEWEKVAPRRCRSVWAETRGSPGMIEGERYSRQREEQVQSSRGGNKLSVVKGRQGQQGWSEVRMPAARVARPHSAWKAQGRSIDFILSVMGSLWRALSREVIWSDFPFWKIHLADLPFGKIHLAWGEAGVEARRPMSSSWRSKEEIVSLAMVEGVDKGE